MEDVVKEKRVSSLQERLANNFRSVINEYETLVRSAAQFALDQRKLYDKEIVETCMEASKKFNVAFIDVFRGLGGKCKKDKDKPIPSPENLKNSILYTKQMVDGGSGLCEATEEASRKYRVDTQDVFIGYFVDYELEEFDIEDFTN